MRELERGARVVVQPAHQAVIARVGHAGRIERRRHLREMRFRILIERIDNFGQRVNDRLVLGHLAVQHAQRIGDRAALAIHAHLRGDGLERRAQRLVVARPIRGRPTELMCSVQPVMPSSSSSVASISRIFRIAQRALAARRRRPDDLGADLRKLPVAALLRPLAPELRTDVIELLQLPASRPACARCRRAPRRPCSRAAGSGTASSPTAPARGLPTCTSPSRRCRFPRRRRARTGPCPRRSGCEFRRSCNVQIPSAPSPRSGSTAPSPAAEDRACRAPLSMCS